MLSGSYSIWNSNPLIHYLVIHLLWWALYLNNFIFHSQYFHLDILYNCLLLLGVISVLYLWKFIFNSLIYFSPNNLNPVTAVQWLSIISSGSLPQPWYPWGLLLWFSVLTCLPLQFGAPRFTLWTHYPYRSK